MLTRVLFALMLAVVSVPAWAEDAKVLALGLTDHEVTQEDLGKRRGASGTPLQHACDRGRVKRRVAFGPSLDGVGATLRVAVVVTRIHCVSAVRMRPIVSCDYYAALDLIAAASIALLSELSRRAH